MNDEIKPHAGALLELDDALALWAWAWAELESPHDPNERSREQVVVGLVDVLTFAACELSLAGHHAWIERMPDLLRLYDGWLMDEAAPRERCLEAIADLLHKGAPVTKVVRAMASDADTLVRAAVAKGLRVADPDARALLETLTTDANRHIRGIARAKAPAAPPAAWWVGKFDSDPIPRLTEVNDDLLAALRTVALFADRETPDAQQAMLPQLVEALTLLPSPILFELVRRFVSFDWIAPGYGPMLDELLRRPQGAPTLWDVVVARLGRPHGWSHFGLILGRVCTDLSDEARERLCRGLLECVVERRETPRAKAMTQLVEALLRRHWPASAPGVLVLDAWEVLESDTPELATHLRPLLNNARVDLRAELPRLLALAERDDELVPALSRVASQLDPAPRHAFVVRGLASHSDAVRALALRQLATLSPDPAHGSGQAAFIRYWNEPALRRVITSNEQVCEAFCPSLRRQLRAGALDLSEASATLAATGRLWGGTERANTDPDDRSARLERATAWHAEASELGPPTEQEWATWRALRRQRLDDEPGAHAPSLFLVRPAGPLDPDDRAVIDWVMARWRRVWAAAPDLADLHGDHFQETITLMFGLSTIVDTYVLEQLEQMLVAIEGLDSSLLEVCKHHVETYRRTLAREAE